ncbi:MAG: hypothetical protein A2W98_01385 [Bacteroidetes bacterium GWF2_33_38]|nr:MAG: hypothetical protein A2W98_01385 [Bacteroidetes bacterium GWF2_33_38]OFY72443.1 MAG: hypothetical protein A2265_03325 [Bacteroidetes bacterium RIFOXYA12_FULL_33_9]
MSSKKILFPFLTFCISFSLLSAIQLNIESPMLLLERFYRNFGWIEVLVFSLFGSFLVFKMIDETKIAYWRRISWLIFGFFFFIQLILGLSGFDKFLMTGDLHLPIPAIIIGGAIFKLKISFMVILLIANIIISGPAWCSQLCYFGAFDNWAASKNKYSKFTIKNIWAYKHVILLIFVLGTILLRFFDVSIDTAIIFGSVFGTIGLLILLILSLQKGKMIHCVAYCPIGTIVSYLKFINPIRMYIDQSCTNCMKCTTSCNYIALEKENIERKVIGVTCTYCGDCLATCKSNSIKYKAFGIKSENVRYIYLTITVSLYVVFLAVARI